MKQYDIIIVTGDYYVDHPLSVAGILVKVLEDKGYTVGIIEKPDWKTDKDFLKLGAPRLFFGVTSGAVDSMLSNYTPLKKKRSEDKNSPYDSGIPDRAVIVYCNKLRQLFKSSKIVIGGIEASMRRFTHYDYWDNAVRKSILLDSRADILVYGSGEYQIAKIAEKLNDYKNLDDIEGTCIISKEVPKDFTILPSHEAVSADKKIFCKMQVMFSNCDNLAQKTGDRYVLQHKMHDYTAKELDYVYGLNYSRDIPKTMPEFKMVQFSVVTHRGCIGDCNFCSLALHQGNKIISRSEGSILKEIESLTKHKDFKGYIDDLGGPSANMYGMDCGSCKDSACITCQNLDKSHSKLISLLRKARKIKGIKKIFVRSGVRYDLALASEEYIKELSEHHISGCLKIAPEHFSKDVLKLMNKGTGDFLKFKSTFEKHNKEKRQSLKYYLMTAHPGSTMGHAKHLASEMKKLNNVESVQIFTPTPMTVSTCMYYTGLDPNTLETVYVPYTYNEKKKQKNILFGS
ncbi:MAG: YgiQ family radical SAM protein [Nanoarchaeota archaeon]|nr:YgiQ family radical SAM protein [Nanoarchaeota archaeon]MBU1704891.1 YgiQ family radical SAM protein [Nanoarchaeota archaeon]